MIAEYHTRFFDNHVNIVFQQYEFYNIPVTYDVVKQNLNNVLNKNKLERFFNSSDVKDICTDISNIIRRIY